MFDIKTLLILIPALPLAATLLTAALGRRVLGGRSHLPVVAALALSFAASMFLVFRVQEQIDQTAGQGRGAQDSERGHALALGGRGAARENSRGLTAPGDGPRRRCLPAIPAAGRLPHRRHPAGRSAYGRHAGHRHLHLDAGGDLFDRLHAGRSRLLAVLHLHRPVRVLDDHAGLGEQFRVALRVLGGGGPVQLPADRLLVREARRGRRRQEGVPGEPHRRRRLRPGHLPDLDDLRHARLPRRSFSAVGRGVRRRLAADGDLPAVAAGGVRQERPVPAARLAARRDGRPHAGQRLDPRGHDGHGGRVPDRPLHAACSPRRSMPSAPWPSSAGSPRCWAESSPSPKPT